ncbi:MAG: hypothetical protein JOS17DRAFT_744334 [Linnemannia elongata]|nr:MAG: hypothetical protein JOS17DRAFT_744334 [Linnemannia elongata]
MFVCLFLLFWRRGGWGVQSKQTRKGSCLLDKKRVMECLKLLPFSLPFLRHSDKTNKAGCLALILLPFILSGASGWDQINGFFLSLC